MGVDAIAVLYHLKLKTNFIEQKSYRTYMQHFNKI
jgi:hypothetical protein